MSGKAWRKMRKMMRRDLNNKYRGFADYVRRLPFRERLKIAWKILLLDKTKGGGIL